MNQAGELENLIFWSCLVRTGPSRRGRAKAWHEGGALRLAYLTLPHAGIDDEQHPSRKNAGGFGRRPKMPATGAQKLPE